MLNIDDTDESSFSSVLNGSISQKHHANQPSSYLRYMVQLLFNLYDFPLTLNTIPSFETQNHFSISAQRFQQGHFKIFPTKKLKTVGRSLLFADRWKQEAINCFENFKHFASLGSAHKEEETSRKNNFFPNSLQLFRSKQLPYKLNFAIIPIFSDCECRMETEGLFWKPNSAVFRSIQILKHLMCFLMSWVRSLNLTQMIWMAIWFKFPSCHRFEHF